MTEKMTDKKKGMDRLSAEETKTFKKELLSTIEDQYQPHSQTWPELASTSMTLKISTTSSPAISLTRFRTCRSSKIWSRKNWGRISRTVTNQSCSLTQHSWGYFEIARRALQAPLEILQRHLHRRGQGGGASQRGEENQCPKNGAGEETGREGWKHYTT